ncbi:hypothetical protein QE152_g27226 [Popillia japonica]|uniref:Uncharacterized protein n=1 Tax=Popillia japonica TaxID=7064 RepID=A0AAW1JTY3_POPJA
MFSFTTNAMLAIFLIVLIDKYLHHFCQGYTIPRYFQTDYNVIHHYIKVLYFHPKYISQIRVDNVKPNRTFRAFSAYHCQLVDVEGDAWKLNIHGYLGSHDIRDTPCSLMWKVVR